jgi:hypothetical protein
MHSNITTKQSLKYFVLIQNIILLYAIYRYKWWWFAGLDSFPQWINIYGAILCFLKIGFVLFSFGLIIYFWRNECKCLLLKYPIYIGVILITFIAQEFYPFSRYPMYDNFPNWSYTFYFEDEVGNNLKETLPISHSAFSHLYFAELNNKGIPYGNGIETSKDLELIGKRITEQVFNFTLLKNKGITEISVFRIHNYIVNSIMISDTIKIATTDVE